MSPAMPLSMFTPITQFAILNNLNGTSIFVLALIGLLLFGKELPSMARKAAKQYFRYKKMITDATGDIQREMESAANQIEEEKRRLEREVNKEMDTVSAGLDMNAGSTDNASIANENAYSSGSNPPGSYGGSTPAELPPKPQADPLALDIASPGSLSHKATIPVKSPAAQALALDSIQKNVPPPSKIPPPL